MQKRIGCFLLVIVCLLTATACTQKENETEQTSDLATDDALDAIIYQGNQYCGLAMTWRLETEPEDFAVIGSFAGALTEKEEELTSTMVFQTGCDVYHYTDAEGYHYFCVPYKSQYKSDDTYIGIYQAEIYDEEVELNDVREIEWDL